MKRNAYLVTGGAGFIGSHLIQRLLRDGVSVICLDNFNEYYDPRIKRRNIEAVVHDPHFVLVEGDILDRDLLSRVFAEHQITKVVHLAARAGVRPSLQSPFLYEEVNVRGTLNILEIIRSHKIQKFIFGSSSSVYGLNAKVPFSEEDALLNPVSPYAATKIAGETLCRVYAHSYGIPTVCLRFFTVYGPRQRPDMAIHKFARMMAAGEQIPIFGDGTSERDYTFVDDIVDGTVKALEFPCTYEVFNLGDSKTISLNQLIRLLEEEMGRKADIKYLPEQPGDVPRTYADISKARAMLNYTPGVSIETGITRFLSWFLGDHLYRKDTD